MPKNLGEIAPTPAEDVEIAGMGIALQALLNRQSQALHAAAHVRVPSGDPDPDAARYRDHRRAQNIEDPPQRLSVDILVNADALAITELDLDQAAALPGRHRRWGFNRSDAFGRSRGDLNRDKPRSRRSGSRQASPPPPREHQTRRNAVPPRDLGHHRARRQRLLDDPHLVVARPATTTLNPAQNLYPHQPTLRLALKPMLRRNPVTEQGGLPRRDTFQVAPV